MTGSVFQQKSLYNPGAVFLFYIWLGLSHYLNYYNCLQKIGALTCSMKFLSPEVALYLCKSYDLAWNIFVMSGQVRRSVGPSLAASLKPLVHHPNAASLSLFYSITLVDIHLNWLNCSCFLNLMEGLLIQIDCMIFLSPFLDIIKILWC